MSLSSDRPTTYPEITKNKRTPPTPPAVSHDGRYRAPCVRFVTCDSQTARIVIPRRHSIS